MSTSWQFEETLKGRQNVATLGKERPWSGSVANAREMATYTGPVGALDGLWTFRQVLRAKAWPSTTKVSTLYEKSLVRVLGHGKCTPAMA
ncbi:hypothetical protein GGP41_009299 [Bipolaris sorokiniana]|uniref:Uncharacterized protein n=1 Tax=Cochliobolus sativus TaxID=45130 RepID=A0A8H5ZD17_COCSA|nr:hypothetical protein GGP41_009299 [Bipolaris sorokiniana]